MLELEAPAPLICVPRPFGIENLRAGRESSLLLSFATNGSTPQCVAALKVALSVFEQLSRSESSTGVDADLADALHLQGKESQYTVRISGEASLIESLQRRFLRVPLAPQASAAARCEHSPVGEVRRGRLSFAGTDKDLPLMTLLNERRLGDLLALRLAEGWPRPHAASACTGG